MQLISKHHHKNPIFISRCSEPPASFRYPLRLDFFTKQQTVRFRTLLTLWNTITAPSKLEYDPRIKQIWTDVFKTEPPELFRTIYVPEAPKWSGLQHTEKDPAFLTTSAFGDATEEVQSVVETTKAVDDEVQSVVEPTKAVDEEVQSVVDRGDCYILNVEKLVPPDEISENASVKLVSGVDAVPAGWEITGYRYTAYEQGEDGGCAKQLGSIRSSEKNLFGEDADTLVGHMDRMDEKRIQIWGLFDMEWKSKRKFVDSSGNEIADCSTDGVRLGLTIREIPVGKGVMIGDDGQVLGVVDV